MAPRFRLIMTLLLSLILSGTAHAAAPGLDKLIMKASHNSYERNESLADQVDEYNCWCVELDLHWVNGTIFVSHDCPVFGTSRTLASWLSDLGARQHDNVVVIYIELKTDCLAWPWPDRATYLSVLSTQLTSAIGSSVFYRADTFKNQNPAVWPSYQDLWQRGYRYIAILDETDSPLTRGDDDFFFGVTTANRPSDSDFANTVLVNIDGGDNDTAPHSLPSTRNGRWLYRAYSTGNCGDMDGDYWLIAVQRQFNFVATNCIDHMDENTTPVQSSDPVYVDPNGSRDSTWGTMILPYHDVTAAGMRASPGARIVVGQLSAPTAPTATSPVDGAPCAQPTLLQWSEVPGAKSYHVRLATDASFNSVITSADVRTASCSIPQQLAANSQFYWQVTTTWYPSEIVTGSLAPVVSPVFSFTSRPASGPAAPTLISPADHAAGQPILGTLSWQPVSDATSYSVIIRCPLGDLVTSGQTSTTQFSYDLPPATYSWDVIALNRCGQGSAASQVRSFTVGAGSACLIPAGFTPADSDSCLGTSGTLRWNAIPGASGYTLELGSHQCDHSHSPGPEVHVASNTYNYSGLEFGRTYWWRVKVDCGCAAFSNCVSFTTASDSTRYQAVKLDNPTDGATNQPAEGTLGWRATTGAVGYRVQLGTICGSGAEIDVTEPSYDYAGLVQNTTYFWRVRMRDACGALGPYSTCHNFHTEQLVGIDRLYFPTDLNFERGRSAVVIPLFAENLGSLESVRASLSLDPAVFHFDSLSLVGTRAFGAAQVMVQYQAALGRLNVTLNISSTHNCPPQILPGAGPLFNFIVDVLPSAPLGTTPLAFATQGQFDTCATHGTKHSTPAQFASSAQIHGPLAVDLTEPPATGAVEFAAPYPNPATRGMSVRFSLAHGGHVRVSVFDVTGVEVSIVSEGDYAAGWHELSWDGLGLGGRQVPSGLYFIQLQVAGQARIRRVVITR